MCIVKGHKWKEHCRRKYIDLLDLDELISIDHSLYIDPVDLDGLIPIDYTVFRCTRCGKTKIIRTPEP